MKTQFEKLCGTYRQDGFIVAEPDKRITRKDYFGI